METFINNFVNKDDEKENIQEKREGKLYAYYFPKHDREDHKGTLLVKTKTGRVKKANYISPIDSVNENFSDKNEAIRVGELATEFFVGRL